MRKLLILIPVLFLFSCESREDKIKALEEAIAKVDTGTDSVKQTDTPQKSKLLFKASGMEPGWTLSIYNDSAFAVLNYGDIKLRLKRENPVSDSLMKVKNYSEAIMVNNSEYLTENFKIELKKGKCVNEAEEITGYNVRINFDNVNYTGCGDFVNR